MIDEERYFEEEVIKEEKVVNDFLEDEEIVLAETSLVRGYETPPKGERCKECGYEIDFDEKICPICGRVQERLSDTAYA